MQKSIKIEFEYFKTTLSSHVVVNQSWFSSDSQNKLAKIQMHLQNVSRDLNFPADSIEVDQSNYFLTKKLLIYQHSLTIWSCNFSLKRFRVFECIQEFLQIVRFIVNIRGGVAFSFLWNLSLNLLIFDIEIPVKDQSLKFINLSLVKIFV